MRLKKIALCTLVASSILAGHSIAAQKVDLEQPQALSNSQLSLQSLLTSQGADSYEVKVSSLTSTGEERSRYQQLYHGIPVYGATIVASRSLGNQFYNAAGEFVSKIDADITSTRPTVSLEDAIQIAVAGDSIKLASSSIYNIESQLNIWLDKDNKAHLAWFISYVDITDAPTRPHQFIDAHSGEVLDQWDGMTFASGTGPGGNQRTGRYEYGPGKTYPAFEIKESGGSCTLDSTNVVTYDMNHQKSGGRVHSFSCYNNTAREVNGSYSALNDAHAFGLITFKMFKDWYNKAPLTQKLKLRVHYDRDYENAFWDGQQMTFGDGKSTFHPLVGLGVVAHEVSHGFTQQNSNLAYSGQSGGLNESFSDIAAAAASYYLTGGFSWQIGDKIKKGSGAMRYMDNPPQDGRSIDHTSKYRSGMDVHHSSGVYNKAFYLLSTTSGWDIHKAFDVYVKANQLYWTANSDFNASGKGVYKSAKDLGYCVDDVLSSLERVGVNNAGAKDGSGCGGTGNQKPTANFSFSAVKLAVTFSDASTDDKAVASRSWNFGDGATSTATSPSHTYATPGSYSVSLTVKDAEGLSDTKTTTVNVTDDGNGGGCGSTAAWSASTSYKLGDFVSYNGYRYEAIWWSTGARPDVYSQVWKKLDKCDGDGGDNQAPKADFGFTANQLAVTFSNRSSDDKGVTSYAWNFGDGASSTSQNPSHTYAAEGSYSVQLTVSDAEGLTGTTTQTVTVRKDGGGDCNAAAWSPSKVYLNGDTASQDGKEYRANWWTQNDSPKDNSGQWEVWTLLGSCR